MTTEIESLCAHCQRAHQIDALIPIGGYPLCRPCLEELASKTSARSGKRRYYKLTKGQEVEGVCGGIADAFHVDRTNFRLAAAALIILSGIIPGLIVYAALAMTMPPAPEGYEKG